MIDNDKIYSTAWLPCRFPSNIRCVVSTNNHNLILDRLGVRGALRWEFGPVTMETQHLIVNNYLGRYSKVYTFIITFVFTTFDYFKYSKYCLNIYQFQCTCLKYV